MAVGAIRACRPSADANRQNRENQRAAIGEHVGRFGKQCDGMGPEAADRFEGGEDGKYGQGPPQAALARVLPVGVVAVGMAVEKTTAVAMAGVIVARLMGRVSVAIAMVGVIVAVMVVARRPGPMAAAASITGRAVVMAVAVPGAGGLGVFVAHCCWTPV